MADEYIRRDDAIEEINKWLDSVGTANEGRILEKRNGFLLLRREKGQR